MTTCTPKICDSMTQCLKDEAELGCEAIGADGTETHPRTPANAEVSVAVGTAEGVEHQDANHRGRSCPGLVKHMETMWNRHVDVIGLGTNARHGRRGKALTGSKSARPVIVVFEELNHCRF